MSPCLKKAAEQLRGLYSSVAKRARNDDDLCSFIFEPVSTAGSAAQRAEQATAATVHAPRRSPRKGSNKQALITNTFNDKSLRRRTAASLLSNAPNTPGQASAAAPPPDSAAPPPPDLPLPIAGVSYPFPLAHNDGASHGDGTPPMAATMATTMMPAAAAPDSTAVTDTNAGGMSSSSLLSAVSRVASSAYAAIVGSPKATQDNATLPSVGTADSQDVIDTVATQTAGLLLTETSLSVDYFKTCIKSGEQPWMRVKLNQRSDSWQRDIVHEPDMFHGKSPPVRKRRLSRGLSGAPSRPNPIDYASQDMCTVVFDLTEPYVANLLSDRGMPCPPCAFANCNGVDGKLLT